MFLNIAPSRTFPQVPYEIWHGKPVSYKILRVCGNPSYVNRLVGDKLESRSSLCKFVGYPKEIAGRHDEELLKKSSEIPHQENATPSIPMVPNNSAPVLRKSTRISQPPDRYEFLGLTNQLDGDPRTYGKRCLTSTQIKWLEVMKFEIDWMRVKLIGCKWVDKYKLGTNREVTAFKARLVAKGYIQRLGVDFEEGYLPVAMAKSIQILLAIEALYDYKIWKMDLKMAFLNGFIEEEIYTNQLEGFTSAGEKLKVCRLQRSMYSLKQASRSLNTHFDEFIRGYDFMKNESDPCVCKKISGRSITYPVLYVDNILLIVNDVKILGNIKLSKKQSPKTDEELKQCTRLDIAYTLSLTSRYQTCASEAHWSEVKTILKYLKRTKDMFLIYGGRDLILEGYSDASFLSNDMMSSPNQVLYSS
ncbi:UNVERIFIED_CONTAM: Retrovirus-related Pol polyprotein from transposon TNT 1-94 [Sesamum indicum]